MSNLIAESLARLNRLLPLEARQAALPPQLRELHRAVIRTLVMQGRAPCRDEIATYVGVDGVDRAIARLGADDLVVLSADRSEIVGAYPVTTEDTPHRLRIAGHAINAMCALDALSVAPLFGLTVEIDSRCRVTGQPIRIVQEGERVVAATPARTLVGVRWQTPSGDAAHSLCMEMVFLDGEAAAARWHGGDRENHSLYDLEQAVDFGARYFRPLFEAAP